MKDMIFNLLGGSPAADMPILSDLSDGGDAAAACVISFFRA